MVISYMRKAKTSSRAADVLDTDISESSRVRSINLVTDIGMELGVGFSLPALNAYARVSSNNTVKRALFRLVIAMPLSRVRSVAS